MKTKWNQILKNDKDKNKSRVQFLFTAHEIVFEFEFGPNTRQLAPRRCNKKKERKKKETQSLRTRQAAAITNQVENKWLPYLDARTYPARNEHASYTHWKIDWGACVQQMCASTRQIYMTFFSSLLVVVVADFHVSSPTVHAVQWIIPPPWSTVWFVAILWIRCVHRLCCVFFFHLLPLLLFISHLQLPTNILHSASPLIV